MKSLLLIACFLWLSMAMPRLSFGTPDLPFRPGERLSFSVSWAFIPAGEAVLEVLPNETRDGAECLRFRATARTLEYIDVIYMIRDRMDSYTDLSMTRAVLFQKRQEGRHKRNVVVDFDWEKKEASYSNNGEKHATVPLLPGTLDPLSIFYFFRSRELSEGVEITSPVSDGKKVVMGRARVVRREKIKCGGKEYDTFLVEPEMKEVGGIFEKSPKAALQIWVTADRDRVPVRIKSAVRVGSFVAELTSWERGGEP